MQIFHKYEYRTKKATTPLTFTSEEEAKEWKAEVAKLHPEFAKTIQLYKVTIIVTEELVHDDESTSLSPTGTGNAVQQEPVDP